MPSLSASSTLSSCPQAYLRLRRMGPQVPSAPPALWVLGCLALSLWLWTLCTACHRYVIPDLGLVWGMAPSRFGSVREPPYWALHRSLAPQPPISASLA